MGIKGLMPFVSDHAPLAVKETKMEAMTGRMVAIDASMCLYQFLVAVRQGEAQSNLSNADGEVTSHIQGFLNRTVRMLECGIKPVYVFDGKPPELKRDTLDAREERKKTADADLTSAIETGDSDEIRKASHRSTRVTPQMNADVQELLGLLGVPVVLAPSEAEATCAALCRAGLCYASVTEDMDVLPFGTTVMLKNFFDTESARAGTKRPVYEVTLAPLLQQLDISMDSFIDFCIMCGCDYCGSPRGVGPTTAFKLLKKHGSLEAAIATLDAKQLPPPEAWQVDAARQIFKALEVSDASALSLQFKSPQTDALKMYLIDRHSFAEARVEKVLARLRASRASGSQSRLDSFFVSKGPKVVPDSAKFDPFKKKAASGTSSGKKRAGPSNSSGKAAGGSGAGGKRPRS